MTLEIMDERSGVSVRERIGALLREATTADFAVTRIRLAALDLQAPEVAGVRQCRVLLGSFDAGALHDTAMEYGPAGRRERVARLEVLRDFMGSGRLLVRSAGLASWIPDFGVVRGTRAVALLGSNHFGTPYTAVGPSFTLCTTDPRVVKLLTERFQETWEYGHDVLPAIQSVVSNALTRGDEGALGSG